MSTSTLSVPITVTIYVRHKAGCRSSGNEYARGCSCRKSLRWWQNGERRRESAKTRSWEEAEAVKRELEDRLNGRLVEPQMAKGKTFREAIEAFLTEKKVEGLSPDGVTKYVTWLNRFATHMEAQRVYTVGAIKRGHITGFCSDWREKYPSANTRLKLRERYKSFMRFCVASDYIGKAPEWPKMSGESKAPTLPLTDDEFSRLMDSVYVVVKAPANPVVENQTHEYWCKRVRGLFLLMRWSGLSIMDALTLGRQQMFKAGGVYRIVTARTKTGTDVSVVLPPYVAAELLAIPNDNDAFFFWSGKGEKKSICGNWGKRFVSRCFAEARIDGAYLKAHRLRDTFAIDLLQKGVPLEDVSKLLGHKSIRTTEKHYAAWVKGRQDRLDALVMATWEESKKKQHPVGLPLRLLSVEP